MAVVIVDIDERHFSINGIEYQKHFVSTIKGDLVTISNVYDSKQTLPDAKNVNYADFTVDGGSFASAALLQAALVDVLFNSVFAESINQFGMVADEEDITRNAITKVVKFKDRDVAGDQRGHKIIRAGFDFTSIPAGYDNAIWEIRYAHNLLGASVTLPENVTLKFNGGVLLNYNTITGDNTTIEADEVFIMNTGNIRGVWKNQVWFGAWFGIKADNTNETSILQAIIDTFETFSTGSFTAITSPPPITIKFPTGTYLIQNTIFFNGNTIYDFQDSRIFFNPPTLRSFYVGKSSWTVDPIHFHTTLINVSIIGNYVRTVGVGHTTGTALDLYNTGYFRAINVNISNFETGINNHFQTGVIGNYFNFISDFHIEGCKQFVTCTSNAFYMNNGVMRTGSGVYASPPVASMFFSGAGAIMTNVDVELSSASGIDYVFDLGGGNLIVKGGYSEGGVFTSRVDFEKYAGGPNSIDIGFSSITSQGIHYYNTNAVKLSKINRYIQDNLSEAINRDIFKYNSINGDSLLATDMSKVITNNIPIYTNTGGADPRCSITSTEKSELPINYIHILVDRAATFNLFDVVDNINYDESKWPVYELFEDENIYHHVCAIPENINIGSILSIRSLGVGQSVGVIDIYVSGSKKLAYQRYFNNYHTAAPTDGDWLMGNKINNLSPSPGSYIGWVCTSAGTPGTWKGFGLIQI